MNNDKPRIFFPLDWWLGGIWIGHQLSSPPRSIFGDSWQFTPEQIREAEGRVDGLIGECEGVQCYITKALPENQPGEWTVERWEYYRDTSPDGVEVGVRRHPKGQFVSYDQYTEHVVRLRESLAAAEEKFQFGEIALDDMTSRAHNLEQQLAQSQARVQELTNDLAVEQEEADSMGRQIEKLLARVQELAAACEKKDEVLQRLVDKSTALIDGGGLMMPESVLGVASHALAQPSPEAPRETSERVIPPHDVHEC